MDFIDVTDHNSATLTGTGATVVRVRWLEGGPYWSYINGPYIAAAGVYFTNSNDLQVLTLVNCAALAVNFDLSNPDGILISTANPVAAPTPPPINPGGPPTSPPPPNTPPPPTAFPPNTIYVTDNVSHDLTGDGMQGVAWQYPWGGPYDGITAPLINDDGSVTIQDTHWGNTLTLRNIPWVAYGIDAGHPAGAARVYMADATVALGLPYKTWAASAAAAQIASSGWSFRVVFADGGVQVLNQADGVDLGDYTNPLTGQSHKNIRVQGANDFAAVFRPESIGARMEIQFEYANIVRAIRPDLGPYTVQIFKDGQHVVDVQTPRHFWGSTWFWETAPRPVLRSAADLISEKWTLPNNPAACSQPIPAPAPAYVPMGFSDITPDMPRTGGRPDIGLRHRRAACFIATDGTALLPQAMRQPLLQSILDWGFCAATIPCNVTNQWTGAPFSFDDYPNMNFAAGHKDSSTPATRGYPDGMTASGIIFDGSSHLPELPFVPFALTGDIKFIQYAQWILTVVLSQTSYNERFIRHDATRILAWGLRELFNMCRMMKDIVNPPSCLLPYSYWKKMLDFNLQCILDQVINNPDSRYLLLKCGIPHAVSEAYWQSDYLAKVVLEAVWRGHIDWTDVAKYRLESNIYRTDRQSGFPLGYPSAYFVNIFDDPQPQPNAEGTNPIATMARFAVINAPVFSNQTDGNSLAADNDFSYVAHCQAVLAIDVANTKLDPRSVGCDDWLRPLIRAINGPNSGADWQEAY